jgi:hypothetical protein
MPSFGHAENDHAAGERNRLDRISSAKRPQVASSPQRLPDLQPISVPGPSKASCGATGDLGSRRHQSAAPTLGCRDLTSDTLPKPTCTKRIAFDPI